MPNRALMASRILWTMLILVVLWLGFDLVRHRQPPAGLINPTERTAPPQPTSDLTGEDALRAIHERGLLEPAEAKSMSRAEPERPDLLGTITGEPGLALIRTSPDEAIHVLGIGDPLEGWGRLAAVRRQEAVLRTDQGQELVLRGSTEPDGSTTRITRLSSRRWSVNRADLDRELQRLDRWAEDLRVRGGRSGSRTGLEISGLREGSLPHRLGLRHGDLLLEINDIPLGSTQDLARILKLLQIDRRVSLRALRAGEELELSYEILE